MEDGGSKEQKRLPFVHIRPFQRFFQIRSSKFKDYEQLKEADDDEKQDNGHIQNDKASIDDMRVYLYTATLERFSLRRCGVCELQVRKDMIELEKMLRVAAFRDLGWL